MSGGISGGISGKADPESSHPSRERLKEVALQLFAKRGIDGVGIREIVAAAGFKNVGSVRYHFGTKEDLVRQIVIDGARDAEAWRNEKLEAAEAASNGKPELREILKILLGPATEDRMSHVYIRFIAQVIQNNPELAPQRIDPGLLLGIRRSRRHLRRFLPGVGKAARRERVEFLYVYMLHTIASRAAEVERAGETYLWGEPHVLEHFLDSAEGLFLAPVSESTRRQRARDMAARRRQQKAAEGHASGTPR